MTASYPSTTVRLPTGSLGRLCLFGIGKSAIFGAHLSQYTPAPPSRTHNPPQCSQYLSSTRISFSLQLPFITSSRFKSMISLLPFRPASAAGLACCLLCRSPTRPKDKGPASISANAGTERRARFSYDDLL